MGNETSADNATVATTMSPEELAKADDMLKLQQKITQELLNSNLKENERNELQVRKFYSSSAIDWCIISRQEKINKEILNSKLFHANAEENIGRKKGGRYKQSSVKARSLMNLHNNEAGRRVSGIENILRIIQQRLNLLSGCHKETSHHLQVSWCQRFVQSRDLLATAQHHPRNR